MIRKARAVWRGSGRAGNGDLSSDSGVLANTPYSFRTRFENETATELNTEAAVTLEQDKESFRISRSALTLTASVPNLDQDTFDRLAQDAEQNCPISRALKAEITLDAKLV